MAAFCTSPLWDWNYTWHSEYPRLTPCFETTVLAYAPATLLVPFGLISSLLGRRKKHYEPLSWTLLSISRFAASLLLTLTYALSLMYRLTVETSSSSSVIADLVQCITFAIAMNTQENYRKRGIGSSMLLFSFWSVTAVCMFPEYSRHMWDVFVSESYFPNVWRFSVIATTYPVVLLELLLSCLTDAMHDVKRPYLTAPPLSFLLFGWLSNLVLQKSQRSVQLEDIYNMPADMRTGRNHSRWNALWMKELDSAGYLPGDGSCSVSRPLPSVFWSLWKTYWKTVLISCILATLQATTKIIPAFLFYLLMGYMIGNDPTWKGILYAVGMISANFGSGLLAVHAKRTLIFAGLNAKTVLVAAIYRKVLRLSSESQRDHTIGKLINLISVDADRITYLCFSFGHMASGVPLIVIAVILLWQFLGGACLAGVAVMLIIMILTVLAFCVGKKYYIRQMRLKDKRLKNVAEMLSSVKVLKLFAWEDVFISKCTSLRLREMGLLKKYSYVAALAFFLLTCSSTMVSLASFITYVWISDDHILDPRTAFVSFTLFNYMQVPMFLIPEFISNAIQASGSMMRIRRFLLSSEVEDCSVGRRLDKDNAVSVKNATFFWSKDRTPALSSINLTVKTGQLVAVVGTIGSGKSSLLSALLGNLKISSGSVDCIESVAYTPQCAWIRNKTIRENVLFTAKYDTQLYEMVLKACCLEPDLAILPGGDMAEVGEKGINLSGGQKQRISLARAAYQKKDLYLFDDPLSAVDAHVGASLFKDVIGPQGMLRETTRILVTHNLSVLSEVDYIVVMQEGSVVETGTLEELKHEGSVLSKLLKNVTQKVPKFAVNENMATNIDFEPDIEGEPKTTLVEEEAVEEGSVRLRVLTTYIRHAGSLLLLVILCYAAYTAIGVFVGLWLSEWTNDSLSSTKTQDLYLRAYRIEVSVLLVIFQAFFSFIAVALLWKVALSSSTRLNLLMLMGVMRAPLSFFDVTPSGRLLNRFGKDVDELDVELPMSAHLTLHCLLLFASSVVLICTYFPPYVLIVVPVAVCLLVLRQGYVVQYRHVKRLETVARSLVNNHFSETLAGLSSVRSFGVQGIFVRENDENIDNLHACTVYGRLCECWIEAWTEVANGMLLFSILLLLVARRDTMSAGTAGLLLSYTINAVSVFIHFIFHSSGLEASLISAERLDEYRRLTPEGPWKSKLRLDPHWPRSGAVSFRSFSTRYRDILDFALKEVNLDIRPGEKLGIVGRTGAGKSTIALSLFRIIEAAAGSVVVDDVDIAAIGLRDLRSRLTIIPQDPVLFRGTLRFNLDPTGHHETSELWWALNESHLGDFFRENRGLDFEVEENGLNLSVGQRQLVCLARAVLRKTKILVLDEATASVDMNTDLLVQQTLNDTMSGCTVLTIAHRLHTVLSSDRVVVIDQGSVVEVGSPTELLTDTTSSFYGMVREAGVEFHGDKV
ncbi:multidrug resistance-associated protein 1-like [Ixodes scapularis]|uniref:multidrug resistance-associated protein 1-like n=1 Tax=Ixodes scapularis TaxID=6945 RepID=UPI001A9F699C|nr:multidrug resistance-associated protein 1-like [Ixodes scapularis]